MLVYYENECQAMHLIRYLGDTRSNGPLVPLFQTPKLLMSLHSSSIMAISKYHIHRAFRSPSVSAENYGVHADAFYGYQR